MTAFRTLPSCAHCERPVRGGSPAGPPLCRRALSVGWSGPECAVLVEDWGHPTPCVFTGDWDRILIARDDTLGGPLAAHIARWDPAQVLAEVEAKRAILSLGICCACEVEYQPCDHRSGTLRALAAPYADHPDFDPS